MEHNLTLSFIKNLKITAAKTVPSSTSSSVAAANSSPLFIQSIGLLLSIVVAIIFNKSVKNKIRQKEEFSGVGWGLANGLLGVGFLWVIIAHSSINKEIAKIKNKKYKEYVESQMKNFVKTYAICIVIWIVLSIIMAAAN